MRFVTIFLIALSGVSQWAYANDLDLSYPPSGKPLRTLNHDNQNLPIPAGSGISRNSHVILEFGREVETVQLPSPTGLLQTASSSSLLWEVVSPGGATNYLFGTFHSDDPAITELVATVRPWMSRSNTLVTEIDLSEQTTSTILPSMFYADGTTLDTVIGPQLYSRVSGRLRSRGIDDSFTARLRPWAATLFLGVGGQQGSEYLDRLLFKAAKSQSMSLVFLETPKEQVEVFSGMDVADQVLLLESAASGPDTDQLNERLKAQYLRGDLDKLLSISEQLPSMYPQLERRFRQRLIGQRNQKMHDRLTGLISAGGYFIAVGALHLPGDDGLLALLRRSGYQLKPVF